MSFTRHLLPTWKRQMEGTNTANAAILSALDKELTTAERDTIEGKVVMALEESTGKWLEQYGSLFGVFRRDNEEDEDYRRRIINYVQLKRGTIPAIIDAIREFLQDYESHIEIYEPFNNIFILNKSKLNGEDHLLGHYYTFAVIDVRFTRPFPINIVDIINEFKPAGVKVHLTFRPNTYDPYATSVELPLAGSDIQRTNTRLTIMNGMNGHIRGHLNLTERSRDELEDSDIFILNRSKLNSLDRLTGSFAVTNVNYNLASFSTDNLIFNTRTGIEDVLNQTEKLSDDFYTRTGEVNNLYASKSLFEELTNYVYLTLDLGTYCYINHRDYLREIEPSGIYTRETYLAMMDRTYIQYQIETTKAITRPASFSLQIFNVVTENWERLESSTVGARVVADVIDVPSLENYISDNGLIFTRFIFDPVNMYHGGLFTTQTYRKYLLGGEFSHTIFDGGSYLQTDFDEIIDGGSFTENYLEIVDGNFQAEGYGKIVDGTYTLNDGGGYYDFRMYYFELGFTKNMGVRPTVGPLIEEVTHNREAVVRLDPN